MMEMEESLTWRRTALPLSTTKVQEMESCRELLDRICWEGVFGGGLILWAMSTIDNHK